MDKDELMDSFTIENVLSLNILGFDININDGRISEIVSRRDEEDENGSD